MLCKIADLMVEVSAAGSMAHRCKAYCIDEAEVKDGADIIIRADLYRYDKYPGWNEDDIAYMESGMQFS